MAFVSIYLMMATLVCLPWTSLSFSHSRWLPATVPLQGFVMKHSSSLSDPHEGIHHTAYENGHLGECVKKFELDSMSERGLDSDIIYNRPEHAKMIDLLLGSGGGTNNNNSPNTGILHNPDMSKIYRDIEYGMGEIERLDDKSNYTIKELLTAIEKSARNLAKMAGIMTIKDLALNPGNQEKAAEGKLAGAKTSSFVAKLMANSVKQSITRYKSFLNENTLGNMDESTKKFDELKSAANRKRRRRDIVAMPEVAPGMHYSSSYLDDVTQDLSIPESTNSYSDHQLDDSELGDDPKLLAKLVYRGYSASHGDRFGRDVSNQEAPASSETTEEPSSDTEESATTTAAPVKPRKKILRKKVVVKHPKTTTTTEAPSVEVAAASDSATHQTEAGASRAAAPTTAKPASAKSTAKPDDSKSTAKPADGASTVKTGDKTTVAPNSASTTIIPGSGNGTSGTPTNVHDKESIEDKAFHAFKISSVLGYVEGLKVALDNLSQAVTNVKNDSKYLNENQLAFRDSLEHGWKSGLEANADKEADSIWMKLKNSYTESKVFDEERPDAYDLGARLGYMIGTVVGYNTARKPDPSLDGPGAHLERALGSKTYTFNELHELASKRAAYNEASFAAFKAALKVGFMSGAKLGPKAGVYYVQRSGARSGSKIGATLGAAAGMRASTDITSRVADYEKPAPDKPLPKVDSKIGMNCGRDSGRVVGATVGSLAAAEGFKAYIDNSGHIEAVAVEYMRFKSGAEHGYKLGETAGLKIQVSPKSPFYIDLLKKINLNATPITHDLPQLTDDLLKQTKQLNNMTIDDSGNEITGDMIAGDKKSMKAKLQLRVYPIEKKSHNLLFKIVGKPAANGTSDSLHLDHIYGFLTGSLTNDDPSAGGDSKLDQEEKALQVLYDEAQRGIMPSSRESVKILTTEDAAQATGVNKSGNGTHFTGSLFDTGAPKNATQTVIVNPPKTTTTAKPIAPGTPSVAAKTATTGKPDDKAATAAPSKGKKKKKKAAGSTTKAP